MMSLAKNGLGLVRASWINGLRAKLFLTSDLCASWRMIAWDGAFESAIDVPMPRSLLPADALVVSETGLCVASLPSGVLISADAGQTWRRELDGVYITSMSLIGDDTAILGTNKGEFLAIDSAGNKLPCCRPTYDRCVKQMITVNGTTAIALMECYELGVRTTFQMQQVEAYGIWEGETNCRGRAIDCWIAGGRQLSYKSSSIVLISLAGNHGLETSDCDLGFWRTEPIDYMFTRGSELYLQLHSKILIYKSFSSLISDLGNGFSAEAWRLCDEGPPPSDFGGVLVRSDANGAKFSENNGETWELVQNNCAANGSDSLQVFDDGRGFSLGGNYGGTFTICETLDHGRSWHTKYFAHEDVS